MTQSDDAAASSSNPTAVPTPVRPSQLLNQEAKPRYAVEGAATTDGDLERKVRILVGNDEADRLQRFRQLAHLEHPNIAPIYDIDRDRSGDLVAIARVPDGRTLGDLLRSHEAPSALLEQIHIVRRMCDALTHAHALGVFHGHLHPDCVWLGQHGALQVSGWGEADTQTADSAYLAPEIARGESPTLRSEVFALGTCVFHLMLGRHPLWEEDKERVLHRRRAGDIDMPTDAERRVVPPELLRVCLRAVEDDPNRRYPDVVAFAADMDRYVNGQLKTAPVHVDPLTPTKRNPWPMAVIVTVAVIAIALWGNMIRATMATWGRPICVESFLINDWEQRWETVDGSFKVEDQQLVSTGERGSFAYYTKRLEGSVAIEYDATMSLVDPPCDVSICFTTKSPFENPDPQRYLLQVGAHDNSYAQIVTPSGSVVSSNPFMLIPGRTYRVRMEIDGEIMRIIVDGQVICEHREMVAPNSGWLGLYAYYPGKTFDNIKLYAKGLPALISPLVIGDQYSRDGLWERAAEAYARVAAYHAGSALGTEAAYRHGYSLLQMGNKAEADEVWRLLEKSVWAGRIRLHRLEERLTRKAYYADIAVGIAQIWPEADVDLQNRLVALWTEVIHRAARPGMASPGELEALIAVRDQHFPTMGAPGAAKATIASGNPQGVLDRFPEQVAVATTALIALGRPEDIIKDYSVRRYEVAAAYHNMGRLDEMKSMYPPMPWFVDYASADLLVDLTTFDSDLQRTRMEDPKISFTERALIATRLGEVPHALEILRSAPEAVGSDIVLVTYLLAGARDDLLARFPAWAVAKTAAEFQEAIETFQNGQPVSALQVEIAPAWYGESQLWCAQLLIRPFIAHLAGDEAALTTAIADLSTKHEWHFAQQPAFCGRYLAGDIDEQAFLKQPRVGNAPPLLLLCKGLKGERAGDRSAAIAAYQAFTDLPPHLKPVHGTLRDPLVEQFIAWRLSVLAMDQ